ncbi:retrovirus-related pol polyprotein from transposon TNT 1-94 [Tanacetum coccineum]
MLAKQNDPISKEKKINTTLINYIELNRLSEDFGKRFIPQQELSTEQAFWLQTLHPNIDQSDISPVKIKAPMELPKTLKDIFNVFDKDLLNEVQKVFNQMEADVQQCVEESPKTPHFHDDPLHETLYEDSTSQGSSSNVWPSHTPFELLVEPKTYKEAMLEPSWIDAMQEEIHEFERLQVWELVPCPNLVMLIKFKWIFKVKNDERGGVQKNKARLVAKGYRQEEGIDFKEFFLLSQEFSKGAVDPTLFTRHAGRDILLMSMMGKMNFFLGLQISQSPRGIFINQTNYALEIIKKYGMLSSDPVYTYMVDKSKLDKYIQGKPVDPTHYRDADHAWCQDTGQSTSKSAQFLGDKLMRSQLTDYGLKFNKIPLYYDNKSAIALYCNNAQHSRSKHIDVRYHFIKEQVENGVVELYFVRTEYQLADIFTKALPRERFNFLVEKLGMKSMSPDTLKSLTEEEDE